MALRRASSACDEDDWHLGWVENPQVAPALERLSEREKRLLLLRFAKGWKQSQIAVELHISQMQVSRLLSALLQRLREDLTADGAESATA